MTTAEELNQKARDQYEGRQKILARASMEGEKLLRRSLDGPQRMGGRRSHGTRDMPFEGRTAGIYLPEWLRARLVMWAETHAPDLIRNPERGPKIRTLILRALYELTKDFEGSPDEEAKAISALEADPEYLGKV